jgi:nucleoside 2-deoxyribosyltransferase
VTSFYLAARSEDQARARRLARALAAEGLRSTARWLDQVDLSGFREVEANNDLEDIRAAAVFALLVHPTKFRDTTGGHHVETGYALALGRPIILIGPPVNVFHAKAAARVQAPSLVASIATQIRALAARLQADR